MQEGQRTYLPAAGRDWALPFYDPLVKLLGADAALILNEGGRLFFTGPRNTST